LSPPPRRASPRRVSSLSRMSFMVGLLFRNPAPDDRRVEQKAYHGGFPLVVTGRLSSLSPSLRGEGGERAARAGWGPAARPSPLTRPRFARAPSPRFAGRGKAAWLRRQTLLRNAV